tara:strand:- start:394 stop:1290 length:897 start_codon:yes stop_codon:yes gene_type:complete
MTLKLNGSSSGHVNLDAKAAAASNTLTLPDTASGELVALESNGDLNIDSNSLFVDASTNKVGIGTNSPDTDSILHVYQPATNSSSELLIQNNRNKNTWTRYKTSTAHWITGNYGAWDEYHIVDADTGGIKVTVNTSGDVTPTGNVVLASGKGINFDPQGANNVNLLDDYEEGTHTTALVGSGSLYSGNNGLSYTKVGNVVTVSGQVRVQTGDAGGIQLTLPFTAGSNANDDSHNFVGSLNVYSSVVHASSTAQGICTQIGGGTNHVSFMAAWNDSPWTSLPTTANGYYRFTITYFTAS